MDNQEKYDELDNIIQTLDLLIDDITDKNYKDELSEIKYQAEDEIEEIEKLLDKEQKTEQKMLEREYWASQF